MAVLGKRLETEFDPHGLVQNLNCRFRSVYVPVRIQIELCFFNSSDESRPGVSVELCFKMSFHYCLWVLWNMFLWMVLHHKGFVRFWPSKDQRTLISPWSTGERIKACWYEEKEDGNRTVSRPYSFCESSFCQRKWWYLWKYSTCQISQNKI